MGFTECILIENNWEEPFQIRWSQRNIYAVTGRSRRIQSLEEPRTDGLLPSSVFQGWLWAEAEAQQRRWGPLHLTPHQLFVVFPDRGTEAWLFFPSHSPGASLHCSPACTHKYTLHFFFWIIWKSQIFLHFSPTNFSMYQLWKRTSSYITTI